MSKNIWNKIGKYLLDNGKNLLFSLICWIAGVKIFLLGYNNLDFTKPNELSILFLGVSGTGLLLILLPFFKRVKVGDFEVEREIQKAKNDLNEFKNETRNTIAIMSTQISAVTNIKNQITVYVKGYEEANADIEPNISPAIEEKAEEIKGELILDNQDTIMALIKLRVQLEYLLRRILRMQTSISDVSKDRKYMSLLSMTKEFIRLYPEYRYLQKTLDYIREIGNTAAHSQQIPEFQAKEALDIGAKLIATLQNLAQKEGVL